MPEHRSEAPWLTRLSESGALRRIRRGSVIRRPAIAVYRVLANLSRPRTPFRAVVNSVPKAGTHVVMRLLDVSEGIAFSGIHVEPDNLLPAPPPISWDPHAAIEFSTLVQRLSFPTGLYACSHLPFHDSVVRALDMAEANHIVVVRDPRDIMLSYVDYVTGLPRHFHHEYFRSLSSLEARLMATLDGFSASAHTRGLAPASSRLDQFSGWFSHPETLVVRFEDLVGEKGGGSATKQIETTQQILQWIGLSEANRPESVAERVFSTQSATFSSGQRSRWQQLSPKLQTRATDALKEVLDQWGYA